MGTEELLASALEYASMGWRVVPLHTVHRGACSCQQGKKCPEKSRGKHPRLSSWQTAATTDEEQIIAWLTKWPNANVGVVLGEASGLIDIETDSPQEEAELVMLFGGDPPPTCCFTSGRGKHWLFRWRNDLPGGAVVHFGHLGIRTGNDSKGAQSVFPPSIHHSGSRYTWVCPPSEIEPAALPDEVVARLFNMAGESLPAGSNGEARKPKKWKNVFEQPSIPEGDRDNTLLSFACREARRSPNIDDPQEQADLFAKMRWANVAQFKPPLDDADLQRIHEQAIAYTRKGKDGEQSQEFGHTVHGLRYENGIWRPGEWKLTIILSDPPEYRLHVPRWKKLTQDGSGTLTLSVEEYSDPNAVARKVQRATKGVIILDDVPRVWPAIWNGLPGNKKEGTPPRRGLRAILVDIAEQEAAPPTTKRYVVVAEIFQELLSKARPLGEGREPNLSRPTIMPDGSVWCRWRQLWSKPIQNKEVERSETTELGRRLGIRDGDYTLFSHANGQRTRFCVLQKHHLEELTAIISEKNSTVGGAK